MYLDYDKNEHDNETENPYRDSWDYAGYSSRYSDPDDSLRKLAHAINRDF